MSQSQPTPEPQQNWSPPTRWFMLVHWLKFVWRRIENIVFTLVTLFAFLYFLLQTTWVQNWLVAKATTFLSEELQTTVRIEHVDFEFFDKLVLENIFVADRTGDTLLFARRLSAGLNANVFTVFSNKLEFNELSLVDAKIDLFRAGGQMAWNMDFLLEYFSPPKKKNSTRKPPFPIKIKNLHLEKIELAQRDAMRGQDLFFKIPEGNIKVNLADIPSKIVDIRSVQLDRLAVHVVEYPSNRPPKTEAEAAAKIEKSNAKSNAKPVAQALDTLVNQPPASERMRFKIGNFLLTHGEFRLDRNQKSPAKETPPEVMDLNHLAVRDLEMDFENIQFDDDLHFTGAIRHFAAREQSGFHVQHAAAADVLVCDSLTSLRGLRLETDNSVLTDTFEMRCKNRTFKDFNHFNNDIVMSGRFKEGSKLWLGDLTFFNEKISNNSFFKKNKVALAEISGNLDGTINDLKAKNFHLKLGNGTEILGDIAGENLGRSADDISLTCKFEKAKSTLPQLRQIIPGFAPPAYFDRLGSFNFEGEYLLIFGFNHILNGKIGTDIGSGAIDMKLDLTGGAAKAQYSGILEMQNFDLGTWTANRQFGTTDFDIIIAAGSSGLTLPTIDAQISGSVKSLFFKNYNYRKLDLDGSFTSKVFNGKLKMADPNINFSFDGAVNFQDTVPSFNFSADLRRLDLGKLNLMKKDWVVSGRVPRMRGSGRDFRDIQASILLRNLQVVQNQTDVHRVDSIAFESFKRANGTRFFGLKSEVANGNLDGRYDLARIPAVVGEVFKRNYPEISRQLGLDSLASDLPAPTDRYNFNLQIVNSKNLTKLFETGVDTLRNVQMIGYMDAAAGQTNLKLEVPNLKIGGLRFADISLAWDGIRSKAGYDLEVFSTEFGKTKLAPIHFFGTTDRERATFALEAEKFSSILKKVNLRGAISVADSAWQLTFDPSDLTLFEESWLMDENNYVRFGKGYFATKNFDLFNGDKRIFLDSLGGQGIRLGVTGFDLNFLDNFIKVKDVTYRGKIYDFDLAVQNVFKLEGMSLYINTDTLFVKNQPYGFITGNVDMADLQSPLVWKVLVAGNDGRRLKTVGGWLPGGKTAREVSEIGLVEPKQFQTDVSAEVFPLSILQQFIPGVSGMDGVLNGQVRLGGAFSKVAMTGKAEVDGSFILDYLKTRFHIPKQTVWLSSTEIFAAPGTMLLDAGKINRASMTGGLRHDHFRKWRIDCQIRSEGNEFLVLDSKKGDNTTFYGRGAGSFEAKFSGTFVRTDIGIRAKTGRGTRLFLPFFGAEDQKEVSFIKFLEKKTTSDSIAAPAGTAKKQFQISDLKGLNFDMNLQMTDDAEVQLIFDEQRGDIIKGKGDGTISMTINRDGDFRMTGDYTIRRGEYLFTLLNFVNKPFTVSEGGTIRWFGDPYKAQIALEANYELTSSTYNLLQDLIATVGGGDINNPIVQEARKATRVNVLMKLSGDLFKPSIAFDFSFPNLPTELKSLADSKLRQLRTDQNEMNRQVFGLVVMGSFLPSSSSAFLGGGNNAIVNTLTQALSSQLSNYLTTLAAEWFGDAVSSIDFDVAYSEYTNSLGGGGGNLNPTGREVQVRLSSGLKNDRIRVNVGSQFGLNPSDPTAPTRSNGFLGEDVTFEFQLTENRRWSLKVYQRTEPDISGGRLRNRVGVGVAFRKEYDSFEEMFGGLGGFLKKKS